MINTAARRNKYSVYNYLNENILQYSIYVLFRLAYIILALYIPFFLSASIDQISTKCFDVISRSFILFILMAFAEFVVSWCVNDLNIRLSNKIAFQLEFDTLRYIKFVRYDSIRKYNDAYLTQRINNDAVCIGDFVVEKLPEFFANLALVLAIIPLLFVIDVFLGALLTAVIAVLFLIYFLSRRIYYHHNKEMLETQGDFFAMLSNQIFNMLTIKINSWYTETDNEFVKAVSKFFHKSVKFLRVDFSITTVASLLSRLAYGSSIIIIARAIGKGSVTIGSLAVVIIYIQLLLSSTHKLTEFSKNLQLHQVARDRIKELFNMEYENNGFKKLSTIDFLSAQELAVNIGDQTIFTDKTLEFEKGKVYLIKGENGSGKSTFVNCLLGIIKPCNGDIYYNGEHIGSLDLYQIRKELISFTEQEPYMQEGTILENLTYGIDIKRKEEIFRKINSMPLLEFSKELSCGLETQLKSKKTNLSGGEKQKVAICRALIKNSELMLFDEPTSALDQESIHSFMLEITQIKREHIIIIISHDARISSIADKVYEF